MTMKHGTSPIDVYIAAAVAHMEATAAGNHVAANAAHRRLMSALKRLKESGSQGRAALVNALDHPIPSVRMWAASHILETHPDVAIPVLQALMGESDSIVAFNAQMVLEEFNKGRM
jgi:hypothetical protein